MAFHDEIEIEDFQYDDETETYTYPCPCGDLFTITKTDLMDGDEIARCPSCSLIIKVIFNLEDFRERLAAPSGLNGATGQKVAA